jgi:predicted hotdog family 3-hydroxylacyl-ACP dehydratase
MLLNRDQIMAMIPHGNSMCMLSSVESWNNDSIHCSSKYFACNENPLFEMNATNSVLFIEYAAQAAAVHASLLQSQLGEARPAYIGAVKQIELLASVRDLQSAIDIKATCLLNDRSGAIYEFEVNQGSLALLRGRLILNQP